MSPRRSQRSSVDDIQKERVDPEQAEGYDDDSPPQDWEPRVDTLVRLFGPEEAGESAHPNEHAAAESQTDIDALLGPFPQEYQPSTNADCNLVNDANSGPPERAERMLSRMMENNGIADLTKPGAWGRYAHAAVQDSVVESNSPNAEIEKQVAIVDKDGAVRAGRIDAIYDGRILEIKTHDLDKMTDSQLDRFLRETADQIEGYQASPSLDNRPEAAVWLEFVPEHDTRRSQVEAYFHERHIRVLWGPD